MSSELVIAGYVLGIGYVANLIRKKLQRKKRKNNGVFRRKLLKAYGHRCMICGYRKAVEAHHIKPGNDKLKHGILLCPNCHTGAHAGRISKQRLYRAKA